MIIRKTSRSIIKICHYKTRCFGIYVFLLGQKKKWFRVTRPTLFFNADPKTLHSFLRRKKKWHKDYREVTAITIQHQKK